jgi:hypothetical protein
VKVVSDETLQVRRRVEFAAVVIEHTNLAVANVDVVYRDALCARDDKPIFGLGIGERENGEQECYN